MSNISILFQINGIQMRWADTNAEDGTRSKAGPWTAQQPVVLFLHGWPDCWFSWRHQLKAVSAVG